MTKPSKPSRASRTPRTRPAPASVSVESALLRLARDVAELVRARSAPSPLRAALDTIAGAYAPGHPLPRALFAAWLDPTRDTKSALAIAWAQEQIRLALEDALAQEAAQGRARDDLPLDTLAWLLRAACEATAHEAPGVVSERLEALLAFIHPGAAPRAPRRSR